MSQMTFTILDAERAMHARRHASFVDTLIPALSDDPETIAELQYAMRRFMSPDENREPLAGWERGDCDEPFDAGVCIVDLAARLILYQSTFCEFLRRGQVTFDRWDSLDQDAAESARWIPYHVAEEWLVTPQRVGWREMALERRRERQANPPFDTRAVLYGKVAEFIVDECLAAHGGSTTSDDAWTPPAGWEWRELPERAAAGRAISIADAVAEIHARWLMTPRDDLRGQSPRQVLQAKRHDLGIHLQDREFQWSTFKERPQPLWRESIAYRFGGYGTHEVIVYYYMVRDLIHKCWEMVVDPPQLVVSPPDHGPPNDGASHDSLASPRVGGEGPGVRGLEVAARATIIDRLCAAQQEWLHTPNDEDFGGKTPVQVIETERLRLPEGSSGVEVMIDHDCPLCRMMADSGPCFWHLDGCNMDDEFPFALFEATREEWEQKQRDWAEFDAQWKREQQAKAGSANDEPPWPDDAESTSCPDEAAADEHSSSVWQRSIVRSDPTEPPSLTLFGLGTHLAELIEDLRPADDSRTWIDTLNRAYDNLRAAVADPGRSLVEPVTAKFSEHLLALSETQPDLTAKCQDLAHQLDEFCRRLTADPDAEDDVPF